MATPTRLLNPERIYVWADAQKIDEVNDKIEKRVKKRDFDVRDYGGDWTASWETNRQAFQAANDAAYQAGGGRVVAPPGTYFVKGIIQDAKVEFDLPGVILKNPDGLSPNVITSRSFTTKGSVSTGSTSITVTDSTNIKKGSIIAIQHGGGILDTQFTALTNDIDATQTTGILIDEDDLHFPSSGYMQVGAEIIGYSSISNKELTGVTRGVLGTTSGSHVTGDYIGVARHFYAEVTNVDGMTVTIKDPVPYSVTDTSISIGILHPSISNVKIDANKPSGGGSSSVYGLSWSLVRWGNICNFEVENGDMGGLIFSKGTTECYVNDVRFINCGVWDSSSPKGAGMWLFQGNKGNRINNISVTGKCWVGIYMDDRTTTATPWDAPNYDNYVTNFNFDITRPDVGSPPAFVIVGSSYNKFMLGRVKGTATGVEIDNGRQYLTADGSLAETKDNAVSGVEFDVGQPWILHGTGNRLHDCTYSNRATSIPIVDEGNIVYATSTEPGGRVKFETPPFTSGSVQSPSMTFAEDMDTGFYRYMENTVALSLGAVKKITYYGSEMRIESGYDLNLRGVKIGRFASNELAFYGQTPTTQPSAIADTTGSTVAELEAEINKLKQTLRDLGLIAE